MIRGKTKNVTKQIIYILIILMLCNFIMPYTTYAVDDDGGTIFDPFAKFITFLCDNIMQFMQDKFTTTEKILQEDGTYNFQYSPAIIFSGTVQGLDVNFLKPNEDVRNLYDFDAFIRKNKEDYIKQVVHYPEWAQTTYDDKLASAKSHTEAKIISESKYNFWLNLTTTTDVIYYMENNTLIVECFKKESTSSIWGWGQMTTVASYYYNSYTYELTEEMLQEMNAKTTYASIAYQLQPVIATWYNALRRIALVGLLSVLVYVGVRIVLSSASDKEASKYKKMLTDWLIALCLLFTLHYIMSITLTITAKVSALFNTGETDELLNTIRNNIQEGTNWKEVATEVVMYVIMTIYTIVFTFQYLKRVLYMGFFTMIAPLVTLTYPVDKIKDGKAQAFTMWIREYIFNALIQVIHLVVYYILVGSAIDLVTVYPLYAIVAIGFITQGERIIRKMFGFENATTIGTMGAAATGGLVAAAMKKLQSMSKTVKKASTSGSSSSSSSNVRTTSNSALSAGQGAGGAGTEGNGWKGTGAVAGKYGYKAFKGMGKGALKGAVGATGAIVGFAAGVAQGDISAALAGAAAGGKAGSNLAGAGINAAKSLPGAYKNAKNNLVDIWNTGAYGEEYAQSAKQVREFKGTSEYKALKNTYGDKLTDDKVNMIYYLQLAINLLWSFFFFVRGK